ncbi:uncharacterized protein sll0103 [Phtheirospermum japonicum]|uniref:Uncharacterized protein sll0103 n=1 Tax=Phtheirospermum japonicum TaxID=374723 RepID=A0A830BZB2_9LAMI|nr:uncharacterized protein sll0103 [Phtheirospermum japonicum]
MEAMSSTTEIKRCGVCTGNLSGQPIFTSECSHSFHFGCITNFAAPCPVCNVLWRNNVPFNTNIYNPTPFNYNPNPFNYNPNVRFPPYPEPEPKPARFSDDEALPATNPAASLYAAPKKVTIKAVPERPAIASSESVSPFTVLVGIKAPSLSEDACASQRAPVDLVAVLDVSGSMSWSSKLALVKQAVHFVIDNLGPNDRLSIVSFSNNARRMLPLRRMTEDGHVDAKKAVDSLFANGGTNIVDGLKMGARVLGERLHKNPVTSIIFLSDGQDTVNSSPYMSNVGRAPQYLHQLPAAIFPEGEQKDAVLPPPATIPVHSFGFGSDHDPVAMHAISDASGGTFSFIESYGMVQDAFASCIGGLLSVVTQELRLTVRSASHGVEITSLCSGRYASGISDRGSQGVINVGELYADEVKEFLVDVSVPLQKDDDKTSLLEVTCSYTDVVTKEAVKIESDLVEIRRPKTVSPGDTVVSLEVDRQRNRVKAAESIAKAQEMAEGGDLAGARALLATGSGAVMGSAAGQAGDGMCMWLGHDMKQMATKFGSSAMYEKEGRANALSGINSHRMQRATTRGVVVAGAPAGFGFGAGAPSGIGFGAGAPAGSSAFVTPNMVNMVSKSQQANNNNNNKTSAAKKD